jgi:hypothetical protein
MTLVELLIASGIGTIVATVALLISMFCGRSFSSLANYVDLDQKSRNALDFMLKEIRQAKALTYYATNTIKLTDFSDQQLAYAWNPSTGELRRSVNGVQDAKPLLTGCDQLRFNVYQRNPFAGAYGFYPITNNVAECKLVEVSWLCSRKLLGRSCNTESVQTAKIVLRNQKVLN